MSARAQPVTAVMKRFNPAELRDAHGKWAHLGVGELRASDLRFTDGKIKHNPSGLTVATAAHERIAPGVIQHTVSHADGVQVYTGTSKKAALAAIAEHHNSLSNSATGHTTALPAGLAERIATVHVPASSQGGRPLAPDVAAHVRTALLHTAVHAPSALDMLDGISFDESIPGSGRASRRSLGLITMKIHPAVLDPPGEQVFRENVHDGLWAHTDALTALDYVIAHEFGHVVAVKLFGISNGPPNGEFWQDLSQVAGATDPAQYSYLAEWFQDPSNKRTLGRQVSLYGASKQSELLAELWAEYTTSNSPSKLAKFYGEYASMQLTNR